MKNLFLILVASVVFLATQASFSGEYDGQCSEENSEKLADSAFEGAFLIGQHKFQKICCESDAIKLACDTYNDYLACVGEGGGFSALSANTNVGGRCAISCKAFHKDCGDYVELERAKKTLPKGELQLLQ